MSFMLRIYFLGLIAFVPDPSGKQMTALLVDTSHAGHASCGEHSVPLHQPVLLARAGSCQGECSADSDIASLVFGSKALSEDPVESLNLLRQALRNGSSWKLDNVILTLQTGDPGQPQPAPSLQVLSRNSERFDLGETAAGGLMPNDRDDREDFGWVVDLGRLDPAWQAVDTDVFEPAPKKDLIKARWPLTQGKAKTFRLSGFPDDIVPVELRTFPEALPWPGFRPRAAADVVVVEIEIEGQQVSVQATPFGGSTARTMTLTPEAGVVEIAVLNLPRESFVPYAQQGPTQAPQDYVDYHFELFYELLANRPPRHQRPVPVFRLTALPPVERAPRSTTEPPTDTSPLLDLLDLLPANRFEYNIPRCAMAQIGG